MTSLETLDVREAWIDTMRGRIFAKAWGPVGTTAARAPLVLFHDSLGSVTLWRDLPERLARATGRGVLAYDRLGFGCSDPYPGALPPSFIDDEAEGTFADVRNHFGLRHFVPAGHSAGGGMAVVAAGTYPEASEALIVESAPVFVEDRTREGLRQAKEFFAQPGQLDRLRKYHGSKAEWVLSAWIDTWLSPAFAAWRLDPYLPAVRCPTLVIHGKQDEYLSPRQAERIATLTTGPAETKLLPNSGHIPHQDHPETVIAAVAAFLGGLQAPVSSAT